MEDSKIIGSAVASGTGENYKTLLKSRQFSLVADEPTDIGGKDTGPSPADLLCMSLAACKIITLEMYAQRKSWALGQIDISVSLVKFAGNPSLSHSFKCEISITGPLDDDQKNRLVQIAKVCPVSKLLTAGATVETIIK